MVPSERVVPSRLFPKKLVKLMFKKVPFCSATCFGSSHPFREQHRFAGPSMALAVRLQMCLHQLGVAKHAEIRKPASTFQELLGEYKLSCLPASVGHV